MELWGKCKDLEDYELGKKIRVLEVIDIFTIDSGISNFIINYCVNDFDIQFDFLVVKIDDYMNNKMTGIGSTIYYMPDLKVNPVKTIRFFNIFFDKVKVDVIHSHVFQYDRLLFSIAKHHQNIKCISHSHSIRLSDSKIKEILWSLFNIKLYNIADCCLACSMQAGERLFGKSRNSEKNFDVICNAIDANQFKYSEQSRIRLRKELGLLNKKVLGYVASFHPGKNHIFLIELMKEINLKDPDFILIFVGDGKMKKKMKELVDSYGLNNKVLFLGVRQDVPDILSALDLFVIPSIHEGFSFVCLEAEAAGLPVVVSEGVPDEAKVINCLTVLLDDTEGWISAINQGLSFDIDRKKANEIIGRSDYNISNVRARLKNIYQNIVMRGYP